MLIQIFPITGWKHPFKLSIKGKYIKRAGSWMFSEADLCIYDEKKEVCNGNSG
jgi:hypothetical protein